MYLEANVKLHVFKSATTYHGNYKTNGTDHPTTTIIQFISNKAEYGAAIFVDDDTYTATCAINERAECFMQVITPHTYRRKLTFLKDDIRHLEFIQNHAGVSGSTLFGGLLDRCILSPFAEFKVTDATVYRGITYLKKISTTINLKSISSYPLRVCICVNNHPNCSYQDSNPIKVKKSEPFNISVVPVDQVGNPVNATIQGHLNSSRSDLVEGQVTHITQNCDSIQFRIVSPHMSEQLTVYASDGPCKDAALSSKVLQIQFLPCTCPIGFQSSAMNERNCECRCHDDISQYVECNLTTESFKRRNNVWISYVTFESGNRTEMGFLIYRHCPFDYCNKNVSVNLNQPNGTDGQCAPNRRGQLCGSCRPGLSLSLGSSKCLSCPDHWPALFTSITVAAILSGIVLMIIVSVLDMTVAVGTLNALIFFANIVHTHNNILLQSPELKFFMVALSWLNLEPGIDTCYFPEMDAYTKTWLQLVFPLYIIFLVVLIIIVSSYSIRFSHYIKKLKPLETLATLSLLSYTKFLQAIIATLSYGTLNYPDGSKEHVWLPDATVRYLGGKHIALFITAVIILLVGLIYTTLIFAWQWLLRLPRWSVFKRVQHPKLFYFIGTYHEPYNSSYRYWPGLLLIARAILYLVSALNVSGNPQVVFVSIISTVGSITILKVLLAKGIYKKRILDVLETIVYTIILFFTVFSWYRFDTGSSQKAVDSILVCITCILLLFIIFHHLYVAFAKYCKSKNLVDDGHNNETPQNISNQPVLM